MAPDDVKELLGKIDGLVVQVARVDERVKGSVKLHEQRMGGMEKDIEAVKSAQGRQNLIAMTLSAVAAGIVLAMQELFGRGS